ncbi:MAG: helix-turn-helix transcriptional regulator [Firmicutes bacterium]|nr:helix-turn-helix transcriptional regulator [Bacillota bacterium]
MPIPIPEGKNITVQHNIRNWDFTMPSLEMATHYDIGFIISGDRRVITPTYSVSCHKNDVTFGSPYIYHRTVSESKEPYENYLIKFTKNTAEKFMERAGKNVFDTLYERRVGNIKEDSVADIRDMFVQIHQEYQKDLPYTEFIVEGMLFRLLTNIYEKRKENTFTEYNSPLSKPILEAIYYIENNYDKNINSETVSKHVLLSRSHFSRLFSAQTGSNFTDYLTTVRLRHSKQLLISTKMSVTEIAMTCGFSNSDYFSVRFGKETGMSPSTYRKLYNSKKV